MHTNILKEKLIHNIELLLSEPFLKLDHVFFKEEILEIIELILENDIFQLRDTY